MDEYDRIDLWYDEKDVGKTITIHPKFIAPNLRSDEWESIDDSYEISSANIQVKINRAGMLVVWDGHHRLKKALIDNKYVEVDIVGYDKYSKII